MPLVLLYRNGYWLPGWLVLGITTASQLVSFGRCPYYY